jgi:hypothetical protein
LPSKQTRQLREDNSDSTRLNKVRSQGSPGECAHSRLPFGFIRTMMIGVRFAADHGDAHGDGFGIIGHRRIKVFMSFRLQARLLTRTGSHLASRRYAPRPGRHSQSAPWGNSRRRPGAIASAEGFGIRRAMFVGRLEIQGLRSIRQPYQGMQRRRLNSRGGFRDQYAHARPLENQKFKSQLQGDCLPDAYRRLFPASRCLSN